MSSTASKFYPSKEAIEIMKQAIDLAEIQKIPLVEAVAALASGYRTLDQAIVLAPKAPRE